MPLILNIETSTEVCSVALGQDGQLLELCESDQPFVHAEKITLLVQECLEKAGVQLNDLSAVAISKGPGSYTGLRVGSSVAKGICYALDKPLIAVDTLESLAMACRRLHPRESAIYCPMIDARRMEVYTALYNSAGDCLESPHAHILTTASFEDYYKSEQELLLCGNGAEKAKKVLPDEFSTFCTLGCSATHLVSLAEVAFQRGQIVDTAYFSPTYIKPPNITKARKIL
ncbi:MAG: tRNA (adenosine(37)-N6)-threonylcarbamoyltransferase complex dimerization subunit type 1 TsaB [Bacteroidota bacterium]